MYTARQMAYLVSLGLPEGASDVQIKAFVQTISAAQVKFLNDLKAAGTEDGDEANGEGSPAAPAGSAAPAAAPASPANAPAGSTGSRQAAPAGSAAPAAPAAPATPDVSGAVQNAVTAERRRVAHARAVATQLGLGDTWAQQQIDGGFTAEQINAAAVTQAAANRPPVTLPSVQVGLDRRAAAVGEALTDAMLMRGGVSLLERDAATGMPIAGRTRQPHQMAGHFRGNSLMMAQAYLTMCGRSVTGLSAPEIARAVFIDCPRVNMAGMSGSMTTSDFPGLLANAMGITMQQRYVQYPLQHTIFTSEAPASDLREQTIIRLGELPVLPEVKEGGEYTYVKFGEEKETWVLAKRGHIVALSWEMVLNDQMGAFMRVIAMEGDAAARTDDTLAFSVLTGNPTMGDGKALFIADHGNLLDVGSGTAPSVSSFNAMEVAFGAQTAVKKKTTDADVYLNIFPGVIICPRALSASVDNLNKAQFDPAGTAGTLPPNRWQGLLKKATHRLLDAVATHGAYTWFACTDPTVEPAMLMGYLDGYRGPQMTQDSGFDTDTRRYKVSHVRAAKAVDWRLWYCNRGH